MSMVELRSSDVSAVFRQFAMQYREVKGCSEKWQTLMRKAAMSCPCVVHCLLQSPLSFVCCLSICLSPCLLYRDPVLYSSIFVFWPLSVQRAPMCKASPRDSKNIIMVMESLSGVPRCGCARCKTQKIETQVSMLAPDQAALPGEQFWLTEVSEELKMCLRSFEPSPQDSFLVCGLALYVSKG